MNSNGKERNNLQKKLSQKKKNKPYNIININNNPFYPIKNFILKGAPKIITNNINNIINKKVLKSEKKLKKDSLKVEEEDEYNQNIYNTKILIHHNISSQNLLENNFIIKQMKNFKKLNKKWNSTDERYKTVHKFGFFSKIIFNEINKRKLNKLKVNQKKGKFNKRSRNKELMKKRLINNNNLDIQNIKNTKNIYNSNNIDELNFVLTNNTITNNTIYSLTKSNKSFFTKTKIQNINTKDNKSNKRQSNFKNKSNKYYNLQIIKDKIINKNSINKKNKIKNFKNSKEKVFIRRIILEEKYTIDSAGNKKTIYFKRINPNMNIHQILYNSDKKKIQTKQKYKIYKNYEIKDNSIIKKNDIKFNALSPKMNLNYTTERKININTEEGNKLINNNSEDDILQNYKHSLSLKNYDKLIYQKPFENKKYYISLKGKNFDKNKSKVNNNIRKYITNNKNSSKVFKSNHSDKKITHFPNLKNKKIHRNVKTNFSLSNNTESQKINFDENDDNSILKRAHSLVSSKHSLIDSEQNNKDKKNLEIRNENKNGKKKSEEKVSTKLPLKKRKDSLQLSLSNSSLASKNNTKMKNTKYIKKINSNNKYNIYIYINDSNYNSNNCNIENSRSNSLNKIVNRLKNQISHNNVLNGNYQIILIKKLGQNLGNIIKNKKNINRINYSYLIYNNNKEKKKFLKK